MFSIDVLIVFISAFAFENRCENQSLKVVAPEWRKENRDNIFKGVDQASNVPQVVQYAIGLSICDNDLLIYKHADASKHVFAIWMSLYIIGPIAQLNFLLFKFKKRLFVCLSELDQIYFIIDLLLLKSEVHVAWLSRVKSVLSQLGFFHDFIRPKLGWIKFLLIRDYVQIDI